MITNELGYLFSTAVGHFFTLLYVLIFVRVILSWIPLNTRSNPVLAIVYSLTEPILSPIRRMLQRSPLGGRGMMLDFSPIFALFILQLAKTFALNLVAMLFGSF